MDAGLLDVLHDGGDVGVLAVAERVDVDLDRVLEEAVDEDRAAQIFVERVDDLSPPVADAHRAAAEDVRGPHEHRVADPVRDLGRLAPRLGDPPLRAADPEPVEHLAEALAVLGEVDRASTASRGSGSPASSIARASLSGVWPPNWMTTPSGCSRSQTASTSSTPSGSK